LNYECLFPRVLGYYRVRDIVEVDITMFRMSKDHMKYVSCSPINFYQIHLRKKNSCCIKKSTMKHLQKLD
jgi:hypothetical protein